MLTRRFLDDLNSDRNVGSHNNKGPEFLGFGVNSRELLYFFLSTRRYLKESKHYPAWVAVEIWENSAVSALWVEDLNQQKSKLCYRAGHARHEHRAMLLFCYSRFCLRGSRCCMAQASLWKGAWHDHVVSKGTERASVHYDIFFSKTQIMSRITLRWHFFFRLLKRKVF